MFFSHLFSDSPVAEKGAKRTSGQMEAASDDEHSPVVKKRKTRSLAYSDEEDNMPGICEIQHDFKLKNRKEVVNHQKYFYYIY